MTMRNLGVVFFAATIASLAAACSDSEGADAVDQNSGADDSNGGDAAAGAANSDDDGSEPGAGGSSSDPAGDDQPPDNPPSCPDAAPAEGEACMMQFPTDCSYGETSCVCSDGAWTCYSQADCPASAPEDGSTCELGGMDCDYTDLDCTCSTMDEWSCSSPCPDALPADGASCRRPLENGCDYAGGTLVQGFMSMADTTCACNAGAFTCFSEANCPADAPSSGVACEFPSLECEFTDSECECGGDGAWACTVDCPEAFPDDGAACDRPEQALCRYEAGNLIQGGQGQGMFGGGGSADSLCSCVSLAFECITEADCPATEPPTGDECAGLEGLTCSYEASTCDCDDEGWECLSECPAAPPETGGSCSRSANQPCRYSAGELVMGGGPGAESDEACTCLDGAYACFTAADCPATSPAVDAACEQPGLVCSLVGETCACSANSNSWNCFVPDDDDGGGAGGESGEGGTPPIPAAGAGGTEGVAGAAPGGGGAGGTPAAGGAGAGAGGAEPVGGAGGTTPVGGATSTAGMPGEGGSAP